MNDALSPTDGSMDTEFAVIAIDREKLHADLEQELRPVEFLSMFQEYTSSVRPKSGFGDPAYSNSIPPINNPLVREDLEALLAKGESIYEGLDETEQTHFLATMIHGGIFIQDGKTYKGDGGTVFLIRNNLFDIVANPKSVLEPATVMATRLVRSMLDREDLRGKSHDRLLTTIKNPDAFIRNPELLLMLDEILPDRKDRRDRAENFTGETINAIFKRILESDRPEDYPTKLAKAYFAIADKEYEQLMPDLRNKASEGGVRFMPIVLISLAKMVARSNNEEALLSTQAHAADFTAAFDYLLPMLELGKLWPELEPETVSTIEKAITKLVHRTDDSYKG